MTGKYSHGAQPELYITQFLLSEIINYLYECRRDFAVCIYINSGITLTIQQILVQLRE